MPEWLVAHSDGMIWNYHPHVALVEASAWKQPTSGSRLQKSDPKRTSAVSWASCSRPGASTAIATSSNTAAAMAARAADATATTTRTRAAATTRTPFATGPSGQQEENQPTMAQRHGCLDLEPEGLQHSECPSGSWKSDKTLGE